MDIEKDKYDATKQEIVGVPDSDSGTAPSMLERGAEAYGQAEIAVGDVYD